MAEKKDRIVKRGVIAQRYKYTISENQVVTIKGVGELENDDAPMQFRFPAENLVIDEGITVIGMRDPEMDDLDGESLEMVIDDCICRYLRNIED